MTTLKILYWPSNRMENAAKDFRQIISGPLCCFTGITPCYWFILYILCLSAPRDWFFVGNSPLVTIRLHHEMKIGRCRFPRLFLISPLALLTWLISVLLWRYYCPTEATQGVAVKEGVQRPPWQAGISLASLWVNDWTRQNIRDPPLKTSNYIRSSWAQNQNPAQVEAAILL